jgi:hypothetical protein
MADQRPGTHFKKISGKYVVATSAPSNPKTGDMWFDKTRGILLGYDGTKWVGTVYTSTSSSTTTTVSTSTSTSTTTTTSTSSSTSSTTTSTTL